MLEENSEGHEPAPCNRFWEWLWSLLFEREGRKLFVSYGLLGFQTNFFLSSRTRNRMAGDASLLLSEGIKSSQDLSPRQTDKPQHQSNRRLISRCALRTPLSRCHAPHVPLLFAVSLSQNKHHPQVTNYQTWDLARFLRHYLYCCTSKASKSRRRPLQSVCQRLNSCFRHAIPYK